MTHSCVWFTRICPEAWWTWALLFYLSLLLCISCNTVVRPPHAAPRTKDNRQEMFQFRRDVRSFSDLFPFSIRLTRRALFCKLCCRCLKSTPAADRLVSLIVWMCNLGVIYHRPLNASLPHVPAAFVVSFFLVLHFMTNCSRWCAFGSIDT